MIASFDSFEITLTRAQAHGASQQGVCDDSVTTLSRVPAIARQLSRVNPAALRAALQKYDCWDDDDLSDHRQNLKRILWIAAGRISDEQPARQRRKCGK